MDRKEFAFMAMALKTYYPKENILPNDKAMELWFEQLQDIPYELAEAGLKKWVSLNKWSPSIADIREMATSIQLGNIPEWSEAWAEVMYAIRTFGRNRASEAVESLRPMTRKVVKDMGFTYLCNSDNNSADMARFRDIYNTYVSRKKTDSQIALPVRELIAQIHGSLLLEDNNGEKDM